MKADKYRFVKKISFGVILGLGIVISELVYLMTGVIFTALTAGLPVLLIGILGLVYLWFTTEKSSRKEKVQARNYTMVIGMILLSMITAVDVILLQFSLSGTTFDSMPFIVPILLSLTLLLSAFLMMIGTKKRI